MNDPRQAFSIEGMPDCDGEISYFAVGRKAVRFMMVEGYNSPQRVETSPVTKIIIECDLPGQIAYMERAKVYDENGLIFEAPVANLGGIHYLTE